MTSERAENILDYGTGSKSTLVNLLRPQGLFYIVNQYLNTMNRTINQSKTDFALWTKSFQIFIFRINYARLFLSKQQSKA